jgi:LPXTG-site transpeptidase (sortase) family protein
MMIGSGEKLWVRQLSKYILASFLFALLFLFGFWNSVSIVQADGSVDLTNSGGYRPYLEYRTDLNAGILRRTTIYVYAMPTESILLGSSATGVGAGNISYVRPDGTTGSCVAGVGLIANRAQEVAGPYGAGGFTPCVVVVGAAQGGVWQINFLSPNQASATNPPTVLATAAWAQPNNVGYVSAWDVTVRTSGSVVMPGRVYANYLSLNMGGNNISLSSLIYVQTSDGYRYRVDLNSMDPFGFIFFSSPKGLVDSATGDPLYHSVDLVGANPGSLPAGVTIDVSGTATHKIFFRTPDYANLPASAPISGGTTWLDVPTFTPPPPTNFAFTGAEGTPGQGGTNPLGGFFTFDTTLDGSFAIWLDINQDGIYGNANDRQLFGYASIGSNQIFWDGMDGTGTVVPASSQAYNARITLNAGEIHFPFIDVENNPTGFVIIREVPNTNPPDPSLLYWDDRTVTQEGGNVPPVPLFSLAGTASSSGAHAFASNYGDREAIENWTYLPTTPILMAGGVELLEADLEVVKTHSPANPVAGQIYNYVITVTNHGPSDVVGATFADTLPAVMTSPSWTCAVTSGTGSCGAASGTGSPINLNLNMTNGAVITINVSGTLSSGAVPPISNTATVTRSLDVTDPNLVNNTSTDTFTLTTGFSLTKVADVASVDAAGDVIHYTISLTNTGTQSLTNVTIADILLANQVCTPPEPATLAPNAAMVCTGDHTVTQAEMDSGLPIINTVTGSTNESPDQTASESVTITQNPALSIVKSVLEANYSLVGTVLHYSYQVTNSGNVTLSGPFTVTDDRSTDEACPATPTLAPLASITCTATYTITLADLNAGSVTNIASAHGFFAGNPVNSSTDSETVTAFIGADLWLEKTASTLLPNFRDLVVFTLTIHNDGPSNATGVSVQDILPAGLSYVSDNGGSSYAGNIWTVGNLAASASASLQITVYVDTPLPATNYTQIWTSDLPDPDSTPGDNSITQDDDAAVTLTPQYSRLIVDKTMIGGVADFNFTGTPNGTISVDGGILDLIVPPGTYSSTETPDPAWTLQSIVCNDANSTSDVLTGTATFNAEAFETVICYFTNELTAVPALSIVKSVTETTYDVVSDVLHYSYLVTNTGNVTLSGPFTVTDDRSTDEACPATANLAPTASITCTASYTVTQADLDSGSVTNIASAHGTFGGNPVDSGNDSETVTADQNPTLSLLKQISTSASGPWATSIMVAEGSSVYYRFEITNTGNVTLSPVWVTDPDVATSSCTFADPLLPGAITSCVIGPVTVVVGSVVNTAKASGDFGGTTYNSADSSAEYIGTAPDLAITKTDAEAPVVPGDIIAYTLDYQNTGTGAATGVVVTETVPANTTFNLGASTAGWACLPDANPGSTCTYDIGTLNSGTSGSITFAVLVDNPLAAGVTQIANTATIADDGTQGTDPTPDNNSDGETTPVNAAPDFWLTKTTTVTLVFPGDVVVYTLSYANAGNQDATGVTITEVVPVNTSFLTASSSAGWSCVDGAPAGTTCTFSIGALSAGGSGSIAFAVQVSTAIPAGVETIANSATIGDDGANGDDPNPVDNTDDVVTPLDARPDLSIIKTDNDTFGAPGGVVAYTLVVANNGTQVATGVVVSEIVPQYTTFETASSTPGWVCIPDASAGSACTFDIAQIGADANRTLIFAVRIDAALPSGVEQVANSTTVADDGANGEDPTPGDNSDDDTTPVNASPNLSVTKTDGVTQVTPGAILTYILTVANIGGQEATGITITDTLPEGLIFQTASDGGAFNSTDRTVTWTMASLAAGQSVTRSITVQVDPELGGNVQLLTNVAVVADDGNNGEDPNPEDNTGEDVDIIGTAGKEIVAHSLTDTVLPDAAIGEQLTYEVKLTINPGQVTNLVLTDTLDRGLAFVNCEIIVPAGLTASPVALDQICSTATVISTEPAGSTNSADAGRKMVVTFGTVTNTAQQDLELTVRYQVVVLDSAENLRDVQLNNAALWQWDGGSLYLVAAPVEIVEPTLSLTKLVNQPSAMPGSLLTFTLTIAHTANSNGDAYNVTLTDSLPTDLIFVPGTLALVSGQAPTLIDTNDLTDPVISWDVFANNGSPTVLRFQARLGNLYPGQTAVNSANVAWTSLPGDVSAPQSLYNSLSYERFFNPGSMVDVYGASATADVDYPSNLALPETGFAPGVTTALGPMDITYAALGSVWVEIQAIGVKLPIVGVPLAADGWDVQWLNEQVGWLQQTAFPGFSGNSVLTAHVYDADGSAGPFVNLHMLGYGDRIIVHAYGVAYTYEVRTVQRLKPTDMTPLRHENKSWLTLITCQGFNEDTNTYTNRVVVRAVLISTK